MNSACFQGVAEVGGFSGFSGGTIIIFMNIPHPSLCSLL